MSERSEALFARLNDLHAMQRLIGTAEDGDIEFKEWRGKDANKGSLAKAACAFANATGGVIVVGVRAGGNRQGEPDVATALCSIDEIEEVKASALEIIQKQVDPGVTGVQTEVIFSAPASNDGYLVIHVPESALPQRSRVDKQFYQRMSAASIPMEMFQIADRFGRRPAARLKVSLTELNYQAVFPFGSGAYRSCKLLVTNEGRGIARYPAVFYKSDAPLLQPSMNVPEWKVAAATLPWACLRGGADDVVYPGETRSIVELFQPATRNQPGLAYPGVSVETRVVCLDMPESIQTHEIQEFAVS